MKTSIAHFAAALFLLAALATPSTAQTVLNPYHADINKDGEVDVADIAWIITVMASQNSVITDMSPEGAEAIDMGFPSGTKWANMNIGANSPEGYGQFFAWAETAGYGRYTSDGREFGWTQYKGLGEGGSDWTQIGKYQINDSRTTACWYGDGGKYTGDNVVVLEMDDDAATVQWGMKWVIPTYEELKELVDFCNTQWTKKNGVNGLEFTSIINGNTIFLPAAGQRTGSSVSGMGSSGNYWASTLRPTDTLSAGCLTLSSASAIISYNERRNGLSIRPVLKK